MKVVITGSTKGIGLGLAREFLRREHDVVVSSRGRDAVESAVSTLRAESPPGRVTGLACDVSDYSQVRALCERAVDEFGTIDIWVNNAGRDGLKVPFDELPPEDMAKTINTNLTGLLYCNRVALAQMKRQPGGGRIFNMEGFGSDGMIRPTLTTYGTTKYAVRYFTKSMVKECEGTPVRMCYLSPGMVVTDLLVPPPEQRGPDWEKSKKVLNILADTVETVTPFLVDGMLAAEKNGDAVRWLTGPKVMWRFMAARFSKRDLFGPVGA